MLLAIDIGNTRAKAAVFEGDVMKDRFVFPAGEADRHILEILENCSVGHVVSSIVGAGQLGFLADKGINIQTVSRDWTFPFENLYKTPQTLGIDRMVLSAGAVLSFPKVARLVIDAGTCVTYDFIDADDRYLGGAISPGLGLRYRAMHEFTAKLPMLKADWPDGIIGGSTEESMHSGAARGLAFEIDGFIDSYRQSHSNFIIILTGGDAEFLAGRLKNTIFASQNFLLESLNKTFQYQTR